MTRSRYDRPLAITAVVIGAVPILLAGLGALSGLSDYQSGRAAQPAHLDPLLSDHVTGSWFSPHTADGLSAELAAALDGTGWCAGWVVAIEDVAYDHADIGSNRGVGTAAHTCGKWVEITVDVVYTSEASEADDTAGIRVDSSDRRIESALQEHPSLLDGTGYEALLGEAGDDAVANAVAGLPAALAEAGAISPVAVAPLDPGEAGGFALPDAEGDGGNEVWAQHPTELVIGVSLLAAASVLVVRLLVLRRSPAPSAPDAGAAGDAPASANPRRALRAALDRSQALASRS